MVSQSLNPTSLISTLQTHVQAGSKNPDCPAWMPPHVKRPRLSRFANMSIDKPLHYLLGSMPRLLTFHQAVRKPEFLNVLLRCLPPHFSTADNTRCRYSSTYLVDSPCEAIARSRIWLRMAIASRELDLNGKSPGFQSNSGELSFVTLCPITSV